MTRTANSNFAKPTSTSLQKFTSLKTKILRLTLLPILLAAFVITALNFVRQKQQYTSLFVGATSQSAATFGAGIQDYLDSSGIALDNEELQNNVQMRLFELVSLGATPLNFAAFYDASGQLIAGYDKQFIDQTVSTEIAKKDLLKIMGNSRIQTENYAKEVAKFVPSEFHNVPKSEDAVFSGIPSIVAGYPLPTGAGSVLLGLDKNYVTRQVMINIIPTIIIALLVAAFLAAFAVAFANRITDRIQRLSNQVNEISMGQLDQPIEDNEQDEIGVMAQSVERMRVSLETLMQRF